LDRVNAVSADWDLAFMRMENEMEQEAIKKAQEKRR
jgi:hypothetical protein